MAGIGPESHKSKKSKHKKSPNDKHKKNVFSNSKSDSVPEEQDASETDLFKLPHHSRTVAKSQTANGDVSDSETDIDKPPKKTVVHKSVGGIQNAKSYYNNNNTQSTVQRYDEVEDGDDEQQSMSLLQLQPAKLSSEKRSNQSTANSSSKSNHKSLSPRSTSKSKVIRKPNVPEMSPSESECDSDKETNHHHHSQPQRPRSQPESESEEKSEEDTAPPKTPQNNHGTGTVPQPESEEEEDEQQQHGQSEESCIHHHLQQQQQQQIVTALNSSVRIKEEVRSNSESSSYEEDDPPPLQEYQNIPHVPSQESRNTSSQSMHMSLNSRGGVINNHSTDVATFEREHTRISAPVIDIPQDSRVWVLQVPRSIEAIHLHGQHLPKKLKGGEVLNLPSGRWQILEQPHEASRSTLNCIVSTGTLCYGMRWLQPRGFWFLKHLRSPLQMETDDAPWSQEITPLPIKELLKMKSSAAISKDQHLKPSKKRHRDSDLDLPSKRTKLIPKDVGIIHQLFVERKRKVQLFNTTSSIVDIEPSMMELTPKKDDSVHKKMKHHRGPSAEEESSIQGGETEKGKKRKRTSVVNEESPSKKKKKKYSLEVDNQSHLEDRRSLSQNTSVADVNRSMSSRTAENVSFSKKEKKKSKHKEICDDSVNRISYPVKITSVKQEITASDSEGMEQSSMSNLSGRSSDKKQRKHKNYAEQEVEDHYLEMKQNESIETAVKEKKKKGKHRSNEGVHGEAFQAHEKRIELASPPNFVAVGTEKPIKKEKNKHSQQAETSFEETDTEVRKKKKHKHHQNRVEGEESVQETEKDIPVKKKKKHKHKESDVPKVKQEPFWDRETSPDFLSHLYLTQTTPEDR